MLNFGRRGRGTVHALQHRPAQDRKAASSYLRIPLHLTDTRVHALFASGSFAPKQVPLPQLVFEGQHLAAGSYPPILGYTLPISSAITMAASLHIANCDGTGHRLSLIHISEPTRPY